MIRSRLASLPVLALVLVLDACASRPVIVDALNVSNIDVYAINVSFPALKDKSELDYLNELPTTFVLPAEAVDRLRAAAGTILLSSSDFNRLLKDVGATIVRDPPAASSAGGRPR